LYFSWAILKKYFSWAILKNQKDGLQELHLTGYTASPL